MTYSNSLKTMSYPLSVLFVDSSVEGIEHLLAGLSPEVDPYLLPPHQDGIEEITEILTAQYAPGDVNAIHILSHGVPGCLKFSTGELSLSTLERHASDLSQWGVRSICLYGCNVAAGDAGEEFVAKLHRLTGAEVAASSTPVGNAALGGNWQLDVSTAQNSVEKTVVIPISPEVRAAYLGILRDTDNDGIDDVDDLDDDNDGILDSEEGHGVILNAITGENDGTFGTLNSGARDLENPPAGYAYTPNLNTSASQYKVTSGASPNTSWNGFGVNFNGNTTGTSDDAYLIVNGSTTQATFYEQTIEVDANADIEYGVDIRNWAGAPFNTSGPVELEIRVFDETGTTLLDTVSTGAVSQNASWETATGSFNTGSNTSVVVRFVNVSTASGGNDFAIDNFRFSQINPLRTDNRDTDGDGVFDHLDRDSDNDGISDLIESGQDAGLDANNDGVLDSVADAAAAVTGDTDNDGLADAVDSDNGGTAVVPVDTDEDGVVDLLDLDSDDDTIPDAVEAQTTDTYTSATFDNNATNNGVNDNGLFVPVNTDGDSTPDYLDADSDNDAFADIGEAGSISTAPTYADPDGSVNDPSSDLPNGSGDTSEVAYREAPDADSDGVGDAIDIDDDNDGILDTTEREIWEQNVSDATLQLVEYGQSDGAADTTRTYTALAGGGSDGETLEDILKADRILRVDTTWTYVLSPAGQLERYATGTGVFSTTFTPTALTNGQSDGETYADLMAADRIIDTDGSWLYVLSDDSGQVERYALANGVYNTIFAASVLTNGESAGESVTDLAASGRLLGMDSSWMYILSDDSGQIERYATSNGTYSTIFTPAALSGGELDGQTLLEAHAEGQDYL